MEEAAHNKPKPQPLQRRKVSLGSPAQPSQMPGPHPRREALFWGEGRGRGTADFQ